MSDILVNRAVLLEKPELLKEIRAEAKATVELCTYVETLVQLRKYGEWANFNWVIMSAWANPVDIQFCKLMISLSKHGYTYGAISMHRWWRRLKACNQQHLITYFSYKDFNVDKTKTLWWMDVYKQCCRTAELFAQYDAIYRDDSAVEMNLRALLGISQTRDIKSAWSEWAKANHPDKGGSVEKFVLVKAAYEEWYVAQRQTQNYRVGKNTD